MAISQIATGITIINSLKGFIGLSLTNMDSSAESLIASGSVVEIAGAFFNSLSDTSVNASSWTAIATGSTAYLALTPSGTAGSQIVTASWLSHAPEWHESNQGWYASAASFSRIIASVYKANTSSYWDKNIINYGQTFPGAIGEIRMFSGSIWEDNITMPGWYACTTANSAIYGVPTLTDRFIMGSTSSGATGGSNLHTISIEEMPSHQHGIEYISVTPSGGTNKVACDVGGSGTVNTNICHFTGSNTPYDSRPAFYSVIYVMKIY